MVDEYDIFVSKLSSKQPKHRQDLEVMAPNLEKDKIKRRLFDDGRIFLATPFLSEQIKENWRFIFREPLSAEAPEPQVEKKAPETTKKRKRKRKT